MSISRKKAIKKTTTKIVYEAGTIPAEVLKQLKPDWFQFNTETEALELIAMYGAMIANIKSTPGGIADQNDILKWAERIIFLTKQLKPTVRIRS